MPYGDFILSSPVWSLSPSEWIFLKSLPKSQNFFLLKNFVYPNRLCLPLKLHIIRRRFFFIPFHVSTNSRISPGPEMSKYFDSDHNFLVSHYEKEGTDKEGGKLLILVMLKYLEFQIYVLKQYEFSRQKSLKI